MELINIKNLSFSYPSKKDVLKKINLKIEQGKFTCIVGENGSGKSTLIKCILGLNKGYEGKIKVKRKNRIFASKNRNTVKLSCINRGSCYVSAQLQII